MIAVDSGLLVLAANRFSPEHVRATALLESLAEGEAPWAVTWSAVHEFLGFVTHPHAVARVLGATEAWGFIEALSGSSSLSLLGPTEHHAASCAEVLALAGAGAAGVLDSGFATAVILREHGVRELLSFDPAMRRYPFLTVINPLRRDIEPGPRRRYRMLRSAVVRRGDRGSE